MEKLKARLQRAIGDEYVVKNVEYQHIDSTSITVYIDKTVDVTFPIEFKNLCPLFRLHLLISVEELHKGDHDAALKEAKDSGVNLFFVRSWRITELRNRIDYQAYMSLRKYPDPFLQKEANSSFEVDRRIGMRMFMAEKDGKAALSATSPFAAMASTKYQLKRERK